MEDIQSIILGRLCQNDDYCRRVLPHLKKAYFEDHYRETYDLILKFITRYNKLPNSTALDIEFQQSPYIERADANEISEIIKVLDVKKELDEEWILKTTEKWCQHRAITNAVYESIDIIDGTSKELSKGAIPEMLKKALSVSFDTSIGHDFFKDASSRHDKYTQNVYKIPFDLEMFNDITQGGVERKTLNLLMTTTNGGKSLCMCHFTSSYLAAGKNVLYITLEMAEEKIAERIDANLLDVELNDLKFVAKDRFVDKIGQLKKKTQGQLIVKEYPTATAHVGHFRALLNELKLKKNFVPDVVCIDYLGICASERSKNANDSYGYMKMVAEELRGLAVEYDVPVWTAVQLNREGAKSSDADLTNIAESWGIAATADFTILGIRNDQLDKANQIMFKQLKSRYDDMGRIPRFLCGIDRPKMRLYDIEQTSATQSGGDMSQITSNPAPVATEADFTTFKC